MPGNGRADAAGEGQPPRSSEVTHRLLFAIFAGAFGSAFQHGYNIGVINAPQSLIESWISTVEEDRSGAVPSKSTVTLIISVVVSVFCVGGMAGGCSVGLAAERLGRRGALLWNTVLVFIAAAVMGCSRMMASYELLVLGRFLIGVNAGLNAGLAPLYLAEISPVSLRGAVGTVYQLVITISIAVAQVLGLSGVLGTVTWWPTLLALTALPAAIQILTLPLCPESPKYLLQNTGNDIRATQALSWLRGDLDVHAELEAIRGEQGEPISLRRLLGKPSLRAPLLIAVTLMLAQQFSGINAVIFFSTSIFKEAGLSAEGAELSTLGMGGMNVVMTLVSLVLVERAGRKTLLLLGTLGMLAATLVLAFSLSSPGLASYLSVGAVILYVVAFSAGPGSIPWFMVTELFAQPARPVATSVAVAVNWAANFIVAIGFLPLTDLMGSNVFLIFGVLLLLSLLFIAKKVPETKNKTSEEIAAMFQKMLGVAYLAQHEEPPLAQSRLESRLHEEPENPSPESSDPTDIFRAKLIRRI